MKNHILYCALGGKTPFEAANGNMPNLAEIVEWKTPIYIKLVNAEKLEAHTCYVPRLAVKEKS